MASRRKDVEYKCGRNEDSEHGSLIWFNKVWQTLFGTLFPIRYALGIQRSESRDPGTNLQTKQVPYSCFSSNISNGKRNIVHAHIIPKFQHYLVPLESLSTCCNLLKCVQNAFVMSLSA